MSPSRPVGLEVSFQPELVEEVVLLRTAGHVGEDEFRRERDRLYELSEDERDEGFAALHLSWFERLGCADPVLAAIAELPLLGRHCGRCVVTRASRARDEGADLLVAPEASGADSRSVSIRLRPRTFDDPPTLLDFLRGELLHVADMLDPEFGYHPELPEADGGPSHERLLRERYRVLWDVTVAGRLERRGIGGPQARAQSLRLFSTAFPMLGASADDAFRRFFDDRQPAHGKILAFAVAPRAPQSVGLQAGGRCPLCRFPTYAPEPSAEALPAAVVDSILADFPQWTPAEGLCRQCTDLYRARPLSAAAAGRLPGRSVQARAGSSASPPSQSHGAPTQFAVLKSAG
jgi:hypothetical protein